MELSHPNLSHFSLVLPKTSVIFRVGKDLELSTKRFCFSTLLNLIYFNVNAVIDYW